MMELNGLQEREHAHFIANEMNDAFDYADAANLSDGQRVNLMELAGTLAAVAILVGKEEVPSDDIQEAVVRAEAKYHEGEDPLKVNLDTINGYIDDSLEGHQTHYARYDIDFEDEMAEEHRGKILNKVYWHVRLREEAQKARRQGADLSVIFIDLNFFKQINDLHGHPEGDRVLKDVKELFAMISDEFRLSPHPDHADRPLDLVGYGKNFNGSLPDDEKDSLVEIGRVGGDEFAGMCYTDYTGAMVVGDRIRQLVDDYVQREGKEHLRELGLSAAIGIAYLEEGMTDTDLLKLADDRMYENKEEQKEARKPLMSAEQEAAAADAEDILAEVELSLATVNNYRRRS